MIVAAGVSGNKASAPSKSWALTGVVGRWRGKSDAFISLDHLHAQAKNAGILVQQSHDLYK